MEIADARSQFLAGLEGKWSILRYLAFIFGRFIMPLVLVAAFGFRHRAPYGLLVVLLIVSALGLEKAAPIFILLPLALYFIYCRKFAREFATTVILIVCISVFSILAYGGLQSKLQTSIAASTESNQVMSSLAEPFIPPGMPISEPMGRPGRFYLHQLLAGDNSVPVDADTSQGKLIIVINRIIWIPYITAYDWLCFQNKVMGGEITMGRSISFLHWF